MLYRKEDVPMGLPVMDEYSVFMTDSNICGGGERKALVEYMTVTR